MTSGHWRIGMILCLCGCNQAASTVAERKPEPLTAEYTVTLFEDLGGASVHVCLEGGPVDALVPIKAGGSTRLRSATRNGETLSTERERVSFRPPVYGECIDYKTRFEPNWASSRNASTIASHAQWLWRPEPFPSELRTSVRFVLPPGKRVSIPWRREGDVYVPDESTFFANTYAVFGDFETQQFSSGPTRLEIARLGPRPSSDAVHRWLDRAMRAASSMGPFPRSNVHFVVAPADVSDDDVVFGMLRRGGGASILLIPSVNATREGLDHDWVAVHELSHLWLPRFATTDRWLSEGIATYLQEVLTARCGFQTATRAWRRLTDGFERGRRSGTGRPLSLESRDMDQTGAYFRVYWAGAAFALEADLRLREASGGDDSLLAALARNGHVWPTTPRPVPHGAFLEALDDSGMLRELGQQYRSRSEFPETSRLMSPSTGSLRAQIMQRDDAGCQVSGESSR